MRAEFAAVFTKRQLRAAAAARDIIRGQDPPYLLPLASFVWLLSLPQKCLIHFPSSHPCSALCGSGTSYIVQAGLQLRDSPALPPSTRIKGVCTTPGQYQYHFL